MDSIRIHCLFALEDLQRQLVANPPPGVSPQRIVSLLLRHQDALLQSLIKSVEAILKPQAEPTKPASAKLDAGKLRAEVDGHEARMKGPLWSKDGGEPDDEWTASLRKDPPAQKTKQHQPKATARSTVFDDEDEDGEDPEGRGAGEILEDFLSQLKSAMTAAHPEIRERFLAGTEYDGERLKRAFPSTAPIVSELILAAEEVQDFPDGKGDSAAWDAVQPLVQGLRRLRQPSRGTKS